MRAVLKKILVGSPVFLKSVILKIRELYYKELCLHLEKKEYRNFPAERTVSGPIKNILIYHISGMNFAGTEKGLQLIANNLADEFNVYFMYSDKHFSQRQKDQMNPKVKLIRFAYSKADEKFPYFLYGMDPHIKRILFENTIDLLITADSGHSQYPFNTITNIPIIMINIFGSPTLQKNIISNVFISHTVMRHSEQFTGPRESNTVAYLSVVPASVDPKEVRLRIRSMQGIKETDFVFGRIGRDTDTIFDPIGINAFKDVVKKYPTTHYVIVAPSPMLISIVEEEKIPNVHFIQSGQNVWDFYYAIDCLAHFRLDGETSGLNIAEAMYAGNPIITHKSHIWNAHLEYLQPEFSRVADKDNVMQYGTYMEEFIEIRNNHPAEWEAMKQTAIRVSKENFSEKKYAQKIKNIIIEASARLLK
jgi:glycosyltransferase involved in cell wall biosynthesis